MNYKGIIIEESLENKDVLRDVQILKTEIFPVEEKDKTPWVENWTLHTVEITEDKVEEIAGKISQALDGKHAGSWFADFENGTLHYIVFLDKIFKVEMAHVEQYEAVSEYGKSLGIPAYQLGFDNNN
jgi:hypothetical protein